MHAPTHDGRTHEWQPSADTPRAFAAAAPVTLFVCSFSPFAVRTLICEYLRRVKRRLRVKAMLGFCCALVVFSTLQAQGSNLSGPEEGFRIVGAGCPIRSYAISGAGDFNGDGLADLIVGAPTNPPGIGFCGCFYNFPDTYLIYGKTDGLPVALSDLAGAGVLMRDAEHRDFAGSSVAAAGDFNGDGISDVVIGAQSANELAGAAYIVLGNRRHQDVVWLAEDSDRVITIEGFGAGDRGGSSVSGAGDVNGDGFADVIIGSPRTDFGSELDAGSAVVILGHTDVRPIDVSNLGERGFHIQGIETGNQIGQEVSGAGDINGDGRGDLVVSPTNPRMDPSNASHVVFGKSDTNPVFLGLSSDSVALAGGWLRGRGAGDVNGDGIGDLILGAPALGEVNVVFGYRNFFSFDPGLIGTDGLSLSSPSTPDSLGSSVSGVGDYNGDGLSEIIAGAPTVDTEFFDAGATHVVFGSPEPQILNTEDLGDAGVTIRSPGAPATLVRQGSSVSGVGDVNGDGLADFAIGADWQNDNLMSMCYGTVWGDGHVYFSQSATAPQATFRSSIVAGDAPVSPIGTTGNGINHASPDSHFWIDFQDGAGAQHSSSTMEVTMLRNPDLTNFSEPGVTRRWDVSSDRVRWSTADISIRYLEAEIDLDNETRLQLFRAPNATQSPTPIASVVDTGRNIVTAKTDSLGSFYIGLGPEDLFENGFEKPFPR